MAARKTIKTIAARKTIDVADVLDIANRALAAPQTNPEGRKAIAFMVETVLFRTGTYAGFRYLGDWREDDTRREYYRHRSLVAQEAQ